MKKNVLTVIAAIAVAISASAMMSGMKWVKATDTCEKCTIHSCDSKSGMTWVEVIDTCEKKCTINSLDRKCGECGGFMKEKGSGEYEKGWLKNKFKCKKCGHTAVYKCK